MKKLLCALGAAAALVAAAPVQAEVLRVLSNSTPVIYDPDVPTFVDLNGAGAGGVETTINLPSSKLIIVSFYAECSIAGDFQSWVNIDLLVRRPTDSDYVPIKPTESDNALCAGGSNLQDNWVSAVSAGAIRVPAGISRFKVQVTGFKSGTGTSSIRLDDTFFSVVD